MRKMDEMLRNVTYIFALRGFVIVIPPIIASVIVASDFKKKKTYFYALHDFVIAIIPPIIAGVIAASKVATLCIECN